MADGRLERWLRPRYVFPALFLLLVLAVVFAPDTGDQGTQSLHLTTYGSDPWGAKGFYDVLGRLGITVQQRITPLRAPLDSDAVYAVLLPPLELTSRETGALLGAVRRGAGLIVFPRQGTPLADSLGVERSDYFNGAIHAIDDTLFGRVRADRGGYGGFGDADTTRSKSDSAAMNDSAFRAAIRSLTEGPGENARSFHYYLQPTVMSDSDSTRVFPAGMETLLSARRSYTHPVVMGRRLGRGRVLLVADGNFLRNGVLRRGDGAVLAVRLLEWVDPSVAEPVVFDEYHQGYGEHPSLLRTVMRGLAGTAPGRVTLQVAIAALVLLFALAVRPIAPVARTVIERRSPLEHVGALSRVYESKGATRLAARRLVRGLRRRHPLGAAGTLDDDGYLAMLKTRAAGIDADVDLLRRATHDPLPAGEFVRAGAAIDHIERTLTQ
jgi:hypothetical protein